MKRYVKRGNKIFKVKDNDNELIAEYSKKDNKIKLYHNSSLYSKDKIYNLFRFSNKYKIVNSKNNIVFNKLRENDTKSLIDLFKDNKNIFIEDEKSGMTPLMLASELGLMI